MRLQPYNLAHIITHYLILDDYNVILLQRQPVYMGEGSFATMCSRLQYIYLLQSRSHIIIPFTVCILVPLFSQIPMFCIK